MTSIFDIVQKMHEKFLSYEGYQRAWVEKNWEEIEKMIFDIKKKREEMRKRRDNDWITESIVNELSNSIAKEIDKEILKRLTGLGDLEF